MTFNFIVLYETKHLLNGKNWGVTYDSDAVPFPDADIAVRYGVSRHQGRADQFPAEFKLGAIRDGHLEVLIDPDTRSIVSADPHLMRVIASHIGLEEASDK